jgi:hypothetical protein
MIWPSWARGAWASAAVFLAASLAINRELLPHLTNALPGNAGDPMLNAWTLAWVGQTAVTDPAQLWHAPIFHPQANTLAMSEHLFGIALIAAPVYWATGNAVLAYNVAFLLGFAFLGWTTFLLGRAITKRDDAALMAGLALMCSPYFVSSQVARLQMLSAGWSVLTLYWLRLWLSTNRGRTLAAFAACWTMQLLSNLYLGIFVALPAMLVAVDGLRRLDVVSACRRLLPFAAAVLLVAATAAPILVKYREVHDQLDFGHSADEVRRYSATLRSYVSVINGHDSSWLWHEGASDRALFPGELLALLAIVGVVRILRQQAPARPDEPPPTVFVGIALLTFVLALGPELSVSGERTGIPGPFALVVAAVPALDSVRAPGRLAAFVVLACGALAAVGAEGLLRRHTARARAGLVIATAVFGLWTSQRHYDWLYLFADEDRSDTAAYEWLATQPRGVVLEMPVVGFFQAQPRVAGGSVTLRYQLASLRHGHRLVNGSSGFDTPLMTLLQGTASPFMRLDTVGEALRALRAIGTRFVVAHRHEYLPELYAYFDDVQRTIRQDTAQVEAVRDFGTTAVYTLRPAPGVERPVPRAHVAGEDLHITTSHSHDVAHHIVDDEIDTRWMAPQHGRTWVQVDLRRANVLSGVKLASPKLGVGHYPQHLRVSGTTPDGRRHVLFDGPTVFQAMTTAALEPAEPGVRITWPAIELTALRFEQVGFGRDRQWAIYEMRLLETRRLSSPPPAGRPGSARTDDAAGSGTAARLLNQHPGS